MLMKLDREELEMVANAVADSANYFHHRANELAQKDFKTQSGYVPTVEDVHECLARAEKLDDILSRMKDKLNAVTHGLL